MNRVHLLPGKVEKQKDMLKLILSLCIHARKLKKPTILEIANFLVHVLSFAYENALQFEDITGITILFDSIMKHRTLVFFVH